MNCLDDLIGIDKICSESTPTSGLYIQSLPGVTLKLAQAAVDEETISGVKLIEEKIEFCQQAILNEFRIRLAPYVKINSIIKSDTVGFYRDNLKQVSAESGKYKGIIVRIKKYPYLEFFLNRIFLKLTQSVTTNVYVYDLMSGTLLDTLPITTVANTPTAITVNKSYKTNKQRLSLFICIDAGESNALDTLLHSGCISCSGNNYSNSYVSFSSGAISSASDKIDSSVTSISGTNGISFDYSLSCSVEPFICNMSNLLAWPLLHKVGSELMKELKNSRRLNSIVIVDKDKNDRMQQEFESEYERSMESILSTVRIPNDICFQCNTKVKKVVQIP